MQETIFDNKLFINFKNLNLVELNAREVQETEGGFTIFSFTLTGVLDGIPNNTESSFTLFGINIW